MSEERLAECEFCAEFAGFGRRPELDLHLGAASRLRTLRNAIVFPTVSPLAVGHTLVAPAEHVRSMRQCSPTTACDVQEAVETVARELADDQRNLVVAFEHGVGESDSAGCGVTHAHVHVLPLHREVVAHVEQSLLTRFELLATGSHHDVLNHLHPGQPYLVFGRLDRQLLFPGATVESQLVRRLVTSITLGAWDWREFSSWDAFDQSAAVLARTHVPVS